MKQRAFLFVATVLGFCAPPAADLGFGDCRTNIASGTMDGGRSMAGAAELFHFC